MQQSTTRNTTLGPFAFSYAQQDTGSLPRLSGAKSHIFQPPRTPSSSAASSLYLSQSHPSTNISYNLNERPASGSRKRSRTDYNTSLQDENVNRHSNVDENEDWEHRSVEMTDPGSPKPFVNTRYRIAGGMDTPSQALEAEVNHQHDEHAEFGDLGYRRERSGTTHQSMFTNEQDYFPITDVNGRPRGLIPEEIIDQGWSLSKVVGGVVGKVWEFCKSGGAVFRGFQAGGGKGYNTNLEPTNNETSDNFWLEKDVAQKAKEATPIPGAWTAVGDEDLELIHDYIDRAPENEAMNTPLHAAKRRQIGTPGDELARNWVVVPPDNENEIQNNTPSRLPSRPRYSLPTTSYTHHRTILPPSTPIVSSLPRPRRSLLPNPTRPSTAHAGSPSPLTQQTANFASSRSPAISRIPKLSRENTPQKPGGNASSGSLAGDSPAAREARKWAAVKRREEQEADESIRRLDMQLKAMIREGQEALGSKVGDDFLDESSNGGTSHRRSGSGVGGGARNWAV